MDKRLKKFLQNPYSLKGSEIDSLLTALGCEKKQGKGSHCKYYFHGHFCILALHNGDCKKYQKQQVLNFIKNIF